MKRLTAAGYQFVHIDDFDKARSHRTQWNDLVARSEAPSVYATWEFFESWWLAFGARRHLRLSLGYDANGHMCLIAPLYVDESAPSFLQVVGHRRADYCQVITDNGDHHVLRAWLQHMRGHSNWQQITVVRDPGHGLLESHPLRYGPDSTLADKLRAWSRWGEPLIWAHSQPSHPFVGHAKFGEFSDLMQRRSHKKHLNWFSRQGELEFRTIRSSDEVSNRLAEFFDVHIREWGARNEQSMFLAASNRRFYELMTEKLAPLEALSFDMMLLDGRMVAGHFGFEWRNRFYYMKPCFDPEYRSQSPGKLLLAYLLQGMPARDVTVFDFLHGLEEYKFKYATDVQVTSGFVITRSRLGRLARRIAGRLPRQEPMPFA